jgi:spermidine synthase
MKPWEIIDRAEGPGSEPFELAHRDGEYVIRANGRLLMSSRQHGSEEAMANVLSTENRAKWFSGVKSLRVLVGGLGLGYTLRAVLTRLGAADVVEVAEVSQAVVAWNQGVLAPLAGEPLKDPRVLPRVGDIGAMLQDSHASYHAVLLDVDNGPEALTLPGNDRLYSNAGIGRLKHALMPGGVVVVWSAGQDQAFEGRLAHAGFTVSRQTVAARGKARGVSHTLFVARLR